MSAAKTSTARRTELTAAGMKMLSDFVSREDAGRLTATSHGPALQLEAWNGSQAATARKLHRDGFAKTHWQRGAGKFLFITDAGRAALAAAKTGGA